MTSIADCIQRAVDARELSPVQGRAARDTFDQLVDRYETVMPRHQAEASAAADLKEATSKAARSRFHAVINQLQAMRRLNSAINAAPDPALALNNLIEFTEGSGFTGESIRTLNEALDDSISAGLGDLLRRTGPNLIGNSKDQKLFDAVIDALHGDPVTIADAGPLADAVRHQQRRMRQMFNGHGGDIGELSDFGVPHSHSIEQLRSKGFDAWSAAIAPRLDWTRITDFATGKPFAGSPGVIPPRGVTDKFLRDVYDGVITRGWDTREPAMTTGGRALYNRRGDHRVLHFKSGPDWRAYNDEFGNTDTFSALMSGLHGLSRDVAMMRVLGPNPRAGLEFAIQTAQKRVAGNAEAEKAVTKQASLARTMFAHVSGAANVPESIGWARFFSGTRGFLAATQLGVAVLSSASDMATIRMAAKTIGLNPNNIASRTMRLVASQASRTSAARMGYVGQSLAEAGGGSARYFGHMFGAGITERLSGLTIRASGLSFLTDMRRIAFQMEFAGHMADQAARDFAGLDPATRAIFQTRGITAADWDALRDPAFRFVTPDGADFITPTYWLETQTRMPRAEAEGLAMRLQMAVREQLELAVPTASVEGRARLQGATAPGTFAGELLRSSTSYKSFTMSIMLGQYRRFQARPTALSKAAYAAEISGLLLMTGALTIQLKELAKGNDPRPMDEGKFWMAAMFQGGGLGIFGDFFAAEQSRAGGGIAETLAGPVVGLASDVIGPVASNLTSAVQGKDTRLGRDLANFARFNTPVGSSLWFARLAYGRLVSDNLQRFLDPDAEEQFQRQTRRQEREFGNASFFERGRMLPTRAPDLTNALGGFAP